MSFKKLSFKGGLHSTGIRKTCSSPNLKSSSSKDEDAKIDGENYIISNYEILLENMNLTEDKKEPLRKLSIEKKKEMLEMNMKSKELVKAKDQNKKKLESPIDYINFLGNKDMQVSKILVCIDSLKVVLANNSLEWVQEFGSAGLTQILRLIRQSLENESEVQWDKVKLGCVKCLKSLMNNKSGLKNILEKKEALTLLAR